VPGAVTRQLPTTVPAFTSTAVSSDVIPVVCVRASVARLARGTWATAAELDPVLGSAIFVDAEHQWPLTDPLIVEAPYRERLPNAERWRPTGRRLSP
jgi:hypothetical protein